MPFSFAAMCLQRAELAKSCLRLLEVVMFATFAVAVAGKVAVVGSENRKI